MCVTKLYTMETDRPVALVSQEAQPFLLHQAAWLYCRCEQVRSPSCTCSVISQTGTSLAAPTPAHTDSVGTGSLVGGCSGRCPAAGAEGSVGGKTMNHR